MYILCMEHDEFTTTLALARLAMSEDETLRARPDFSTMLEYFAAMRDADDDEAAFGSPLAELLPWSRRIENENRSRSDNPENFPANNPFNPLNNAPVNEGPFIAVPNVL